MTFFGWTTEYCLSTGDKCLVARDGDSIINSDESRRVPLCAREMVVEGGDCVHHAVREMRARAALEERRRP